MTYRKRTIPQATRRAVAERYGCTPGTTLRDVPCHWCGTPADIVWERLHSGKPGAWVWFGHHLDHLIPEFHGGTEHPDNIVLACQRCNSSRGHSLPIANTLSEEGSPNSLVPHPRKGREGKGLGRDALLHASCSQEGGGLPPFKRCPKCVTDRPMEAFWRSSSRKDGYQSLCRFCIQSTKRNRAKNQPSGSHRGRKLWAYDLTVADFDAMLAAQGGVCAICGEAETIRAKSGVLYSLAVDHDHATGVVRGLLCNRCNRGLGCFKDDTERMRVAIDYLDNPLASAAAALGSRVGCRSAIAGWWG